MITTNSFTQFLLKNKPSGYVPKHDSSSVNFSNLENALGFSPKVKKAIKKVDFNDINQYGDRSSSALKKKISHWLRIPVEVVSLGNGSDELIDRIAEIFIEPNDTVITQTPTFFRVIEASLKMKAKVETVKAREREGFSLDGAYVSRMIQAIKIKKPKIVWICTPCNPTGETMSLEGIKKIAATAKGIVVVDEVYQELYDAENRQSAARLISKHNNILVLKSFSKAFGLAGIRVGFIIGNPAIIDIFEKTRLNFNISVFSQKIAEAAIDDLLFVKHCSHFFQKERAWLFAEIKKLPTMVFGADSKINVFILRHKTKDLFQELLRRGILTADFRNANGMEGKGYVRVTIKTRKENKMLLKALKEIK